MKFEIRREVALPAGRDEVWRAIATPRGQAGWIVPFDDAPDVSPGDVVEDPPHRLEQRFGAQTVEYVLDAADDGGTVLRFVHSGVGEEYWGDGWEAVTELGWDLHLFSLAQYLGHFPGRPAVYVEVDAPQGRDVWPNLLAALDDPHDGDRVDTPVGPGVVDIRTDTCLGVRTDSALVRFHERSPIGLDPVVGHHEVGPADPAALVATWTTWLEARA